MREREGTYNPIPSHPIGLNGGINTYGYATGNPINYVDPMCEFGIAGAFGFKVGSVSRTRFEERVCRLLDQIPP